MDWANSDTFGAAGGMVSSVADMTNWMRMLLNGGCLDGRQILQPATVKEMFTPGMAAAPTFTELPPIGDETGFNYGLGWGVYYFHGHPVMEKGGALYGIRSITVLVPDLYLGVAGPDTQAQIQKIGDKLASLGTPTPMPANPEPMTAPPAAYTGTYTNPIYGSFTLTSDGTEIQVSAGPGHFAGTQAHLSRDTFNVVWQQLSSGSNTITFTLGPDGQATQFQTDALGAFTRVTDSGGGAGR